jgi:hypothetical protein
MGIVNLTKIHPLDLQDVGVGSHGKPNILRLTRMHFAHLDNTHPSHPVGKDTFVGVDFSAIKMDPRTKNGPTSTVNPIRERRVLRNSVSLAISVERCLMISILMELSSGAAMTS